MMFTCHSLLYHKRFTSAASITNLIAGLSFLITTDICGKRWEKTCRGSIWGRSDLPESFDTFGANVSIIIIVQDLASLDIRNRRAVFWMMFMRYGVNFFGYKRTRSMVFRALSPLIPLFCSFLLEFSRFYPPPPLVLLLQTTRGKAREIPLIGWRMLCFLGSGEEYLDFEAWWSPEAPASPRKTKSGFKVRVASFHAFLSEFDRF